MLPKELLRNKSLLKHKDFYFELESMTIDYVYSKELAYRTMLWLYECTNNRELKRDMDRNPNFYNYRRGDNIDLYEDISYECHIVKLINEAAFDFLFSKIRVNKLTCDYIYFVIYILNKEFDYNINIFNKCKEFEIVKEFWDK